MICGWSNVSPDSAGGGTGNGLTAAKPLRGVGSGAKGGSEPGDGPGMLGRGSGPPEGADPVGGQGRCRPTLGLQPARAEGGS